MTNRARIGIDLGGTKIEGIRLEADGSISARARVPTPNGNYAATVEAVTGLVGTLDPDGSLRVGVGTPGAWIPSRGQMQNCNSTWLNGQPLLDDLGERLGARVRIANDADCFTLSEARDGSGTGRPVVFGVILGTGVGGGLTVEGQLIQGPNGLTGEWGHTPIRGLERLRRRIPALDERPCYCGRTDCVETYLSGPGLAAVHSTLWPDGREADGSPVRAERIYQRAALDAASVNWLDDWQLAERADRAAVPPAARARATLSVYCRLLAENLAQIVNVLDPDAIVLGGGLSEMRAIYPAVHKQMASAVFGDVFVTELLAPRYGAASGVRGAAWLWEAQE